MTTPSDNVLALPHQTTRHLRVRAQVIAYLFLLPALLAFSLFAWYPIVRSVFLSFQDIGLRELQAGNLGLVNQDYYIGLENYDRMAADPVFEASWRNSYEFAGLSVLMGFFVPVLVAILVNEMRRIKGFFRLVYFLPNVIPGVIALLVWQQMYKVPNGYLNLLLIELGFEWQTWIQDPLLVKPSMLVIMTWGGFGATMLLYLASLQDLPVELYEAAEIDGANAFDRIQHITLPHLRPTMLILLILQIIGVAQVFLEPFVLENYPGQSATTPVLTIYRKAFLNGEYGLASAWSVLLIVLLAGFSLIYLRISRVLERDDPAVESAQTGAVRWTFYPVFAVSVALLALLTVVLDDFLGRDAAASFVVLIGYVLLTYRLPGWIKRGVQIGIALAALVLALRLVGAEVTVLAVLLVLALVLLNRFDITTYRLARRYPALAPLQADAVKNGLRLAVLLLVFAVCVTLAGTVAGALLGVLLNALLAANMKLPRWYALGVAGGLVLVLLAAVVSLTSIVVTAGAVIALAFLLTYQPDLTTWPGRILYAVTAVGIVAAAFALTNGGLSDPGDMPLRDVVTVVLLGGVGNFVLFSNPTSHSIAWERGVISRLELQTLAGRALYRAIMLFLLLLSVTVVFPFVFAFTAGLKESNAIFRSGLQLWPDDPLWETYQTAWDRFDILNLFRNTLAVVSGGLAVQLGVSLLAAYSLSRLNPRGGRFVMLGFLVTLMIPGIAYLVPLYVTVTDLPVLHISLLGSYWGIWLPYGVNAFTIFVLKNFFDGLPSELFDAARVDGAGPLDILWMIVLPLSRSILIVLSILTFVNFWRDFLWPYLILLREPDKQPISVYLYQVTASSIIPMNVQMASYFLAMVPPLVVAIALQRYMRQGLSLGAVKG